MSAGTSLAGQAPSSASDSLSALSQKPAAAAPTRDPRIRRFAYNENHVYRLDLYLKSVTALQLSQSEEVESILIGDSASWEVVKLKAGNVVSIKPTLPSATTNMTIYTNRRVYTFELRCIGEFTGGSNAAPIFRSIFTYADDEKPEESSGTSLEPDRLRADYLFSGDAAFRPRWVQDDGRQTMFFLPEGAPRPAVFRVGSGNNEQLINSRTNGNQIIVDGTSDYWILRIGNESVCIGRTGPTRLNRNVSVK